LTADPAGTGVSGLRGRYQRPLWILLGVAGLVLLIACANLANLMLARASAREREIAVRLAIGASRSRIVRQLTAESVLIAAIGASLGALLARVLSQFLVALISTQGDRLVFDFAPNWRVLGFMCALAATTTIVFGLVPALRATVDSPALAMKTGGRGATDSRERFGLRRLLVIAQVALSLVLVVGALLFVRTLRNLTSIDSGFRRDGVLVVNFDLRNMPVELSQAAAFDRELRTRLAALVGIDSTASAYVVPLSGSGWNERIVVDGVAEKTETNANRVSPGFFHLFGMSILAGRDVDERDTANAPQVAVVNQSFAQRAFGTTSAVGRHFRLEVGPDQPNPVYTVVGVVVDTKYNDLHEPIGPIAYFPMAQETELRRITSMKIFARSRLPAAELTAQIVAAAREMNPSMLLSFRSLEGTVHDTLLKERLMATLSGFFGGLAALLATVGLYGVMSYMVTRRRNEIGIRMALGADRATVIRMILRDGVLLLGIGLFVGAVLSMAAARAATTLLFGVSPGDPATLATAALGLAAVATLASWIPAHRASRLDPTAALREE